MARARFRNRVVLAGALALVATGCGVTGDAGGSSLSSGSGSGSGSGSTAATSTTPGSDTSPDKPFESTGGAVFLRDAAEATGEVQSLKLAMTMAMTGVPEVGDIEITTDGAFDNRTGQGYMTMDMSSLFDATGDMGLPEGSGVIEMVMDGDTVYMKSPLFSMLGDESKPWVKVDAAELEGDSSTLGTGVQTDPSAFVDFLKGASDSVEEVGTEEVRGVTTTHLRADIDLEKLLAEASDSEKAEMEAQLESLGGGSLGTLPVEVWIDGDGYVRKLTMTFDMSELSSDESMGASSMVMTMELYDFDEPVDIQIPDPSQVGDLGAGMFGN